MKIFAAALITISAAFVVWWNYADFVWTYPKYKFQIRDWSWRHFGDPFDRQRLRIAGLRAIDCSPRALHDLAISECVSRAQQRRQAFYARANFCGIDSCGVMGVIGSAEGPAYEVWFDVWNNYVKVARRRCPIPLEVSKGNYTSGVTCEPQSASQQDWETIQDDLAEQRQGFVR